MMNFLYQKTPLFFMTQNFWRDEAFSYSMASQSILEIVKTTASDFNPPLYYILLHFWMKLFGHGEIALRSFSFLAFIILLYVAILFIEDVFHIKGKWVNIYVLMMALNPVLLYYGFEARMYSLFALFSILSWYAYSRKKDRLFIFSAIAGFYTHYYFLFVWGMQLVSYWLYEKKSIDWKSYKTMLLPFIAFLPWLFYVLPTMLRQTRTFWIDKATIKDVAESFGVLITGYEKAWGYYDSYILIVSAIVAICGGILLYHVMKKGDHAVRRQTTTLALWSLLPYFGLLVISFVKPLFLTRYLIFCSVGVTLLLIYVLHRSDQKLRILVTGIVFMTIFHYSLFTFQYKRKENVKAQIGQIKALVSKDDMVYITDSTLYFTLKYYYPEAQLRVYGDRTDVPAFVGLALIPSSIFTQSLPIYPQKAFIIHSLDNIEAVSVY